MQLRRAVAGDLEAAGELTVRAYESFVHGPDDPYIGQLRDAARRDATAELWVAVDDDRLLGCVTSCPPGSAWREIGRDDEGEFRMLAVDPAARGAGVGTALARLCEDRARAHGATGMALSSLAAMTDAHRVYTRLGYSRDLERDWWPEPDIQLLAFQKVF